MSELSKGQPKFYMRALETERLRLREFRQDDLRDVLSWEEAPSVPPIEVEAQGFLDYCFREYRERGIGPWGMELKEIGRMVGNCGFPHIDWKHRGGEVNYYIAPQHRGQGLVPEALHALLEFGFVDIGLNRIEARCTLDNSGSERVMQKVGMRFERVLPCGGFARDQCRDEKLYAIIRDHFKPRGSAPVPA